MKISLAVLFVVLVYFRPIILVRLLKNSAILIAIALVIIVSCMSSCVTSFSSSVIPRTQVSVYGNRATVNTPYGSVGTKLPSYPVYSQPKKIEGSYCKWLSKDVVKCLQVIPQEKGEYYDIFLIQKTNTIDTLVREVRLNLQKIDGAYFLIREKSILVSIKEGKAIFQKETFKRTDK